MVQPLTRSEKTFTLLKNLKYLVILCSHTRYNSKVEKTSEAEVLKGIEETVVKEAERYMGTDVKDFVEAPWRLFRIMLEFESD